MSAYLCDEQHLSAIAEILARTSIFRPETPEEIFPLVVRENVRSLKARYPSYPDMWEGADKMAYSPQHAEDAPLAQRLKALHCYSYQSCEHNEWERCKVRRAVREALYMVASEIAQQHPDYASACWGWKE